MPLLIVGNCPKKGMDFCHVGQIKIHPLFYSLYDYIAMTRYLIFIIGAVLFVLYSGVSLFGTQLKDSLYQHRNNENINNAAPVLALSAPPVGIGVSYELEEPNTNGKKRKRFNLQPIYPNPVNNICYLFIDWYDVEAKATAELKIYDIRGTSIKDITYLMSRSTSEAGTKVEISVDDIPTGMYLVVLSSAESLARSRPLIIIR